MVLEEKRRIKMTIHLSFMILWLGLSGGSKWLHRLDQAGKIKHPRDGRKGSAKSNGTAGHYTQQLSQGPHGTAIGGVLLKR